MAVYKHLQRRCRQQPAQKTVLQVLRNQVSLFNGKNQARNSNKFNKINI